MQRQTAPVLTTNPQARSAPASGLDAWLDAAHRGGAAWSQSAPDTAQGSTTAPAAGAVVQREEAAGTEAATAAETVKLTIEWSGKFGADLSARLRVQGRNGKKDAWVTLVEDVQVTDANGTEGSAAEKLSHTVDVDRYAEYRVTFSPVAEKPDDRYRATSASMRVGASAAAATLSARLDVNRWNRKNVDDVWTGRNIDPDKADDVVQASLLGRSVTVNEAVVPRVEQTNALYEALPEATKAEIRESLFVTGGYAVRTTSQGGYSNHSVGFAIDVNYHESTKQNHHFEETDLGLLKNLVQPVVKTDPAFAGFDIMDEKGLRQLHAAQAFNERFPAYLANLLDLGADAKELDQYLNLEKSIAYYAGYFRNLREQKARELLDGIDSSMLSKAVKAQKDATKKAQLQLIQSNWQVLRAWLFGVTVRDRQNKQDKRIVGMIPLREDVLKMFLDTGWDWGGNWESEKDYMHFEDRQAIARVQLESGRTP